MAWRPFENSKYEVYDYKNKNADDAAVIALCLAAATAGDGG